MADKVRNLDVLITDSNTVYKSVPFTVVTDWIQQGRLLGEDKVRTAGRETWLFLKDVPALQPYFPKPQPHRTDDAAEAMEPLESSFALPSSRREESDEEVDMIPLIDVSLVLLVFFVMTAAVSGPAVISNINTPGAEYQLQSVEKNNLWIGISVRMADDKVVFDDKGWPQADYSFGNGETTTIQPNDSPESTLAELKELLQDKKGSVPISLRADRSLPNEVIIETTTALQTLEAELNRRPERANRANKLRLDFYGEVTVTE